ncbi:MAG: ATP-binding cassette domain-containing protein [Eubacteriales bacterium]|nr:ATP-binding cassette domain-containing protein [Eubacteriales bacterium]MDY2932914.1 ATP-binding cassette domain-containing protein [Anaerovoracaceae bacterium]
MIILSANDITKAYGTDVILKDISFHINAGDRVGLIGLNGAGKTTLLNILSGDLDADSGNVFVSNDTVIGYLRQNDDFTSENTVIEEIDGIFTELHRMEREMPALSQQIAEATASGNKSQQEIDSMLHRYDQMQEDYDRAGGYTYKGEIRGVLSSMAFAEDTYNKKISMLSGGERTRLALCCLLLKKPDILILDEPTNHLDIGTLKWLEQYLRGYRGTIIIVSHDRYFLDQSVNRIFEISNHKLRVYEGNYSEYAVKRKEIRENEIRTYQKQQTEIARQEEMIRRMKERGTEKLAKRAASREKRLEHIERLEMPESEKGRMKLHFKENFKSGNDVILAEGLSKSFGYGPERKELFRNVDLDIKRGERICIVGPNGVGKTTLLKILLDQIEPDSGRIKIGYNVAFAYYDQGQRLLNSANTVLEELKESYRLYTDTEMRSLLGRFLFRNEDVFLNVGSLSGGEKARLSLIKIMLSGANVLVLDEPTNHLDIDSKEVFEEALLDFPGTVIVVSHDRYFLNRIPTRILELENDGIHEFLGTYDYYVEKKQQIESGKKYLNEMAGASKAQEAAENTGSAEERRRKKEQEAADRRKKREIENLENRIAELEAAIEDFEAQMCLEENLSDHVKLAKINEECQNARDELAEVYDKWVEIQE